MQRVCNISVPGSAVSIPHPEMDYGNYLDLMITWLFSFCLYYIVILYRYN